MQSYEWLETIAQAPLRLLVRETGEPTKVAPIGAGRIASEATGQFLSCLGAERVIGEHSSVVDPYLKVAGRSLYDDSWLKARLFHRSDRFSADIIDHAESMSAVWADEDVRTVCIFPSEPADCRVDLLGIPTLAQQHASVAMKDANVESLASHRGELLSDDRSCD